jgi:hypothetical protein
MKNMHGKLGNRIAEISVMQSEWSEWDTAATGLEENDTSGREVQGEIGQIGSKTIGERSDRGGLGEVGEGENQGYRIR